MNRIDAISELYTLGTEAEMLLEALNHAQEQATTCRLNGWMTMAGVCNTEAALLLRRLEVIGQKQCSLIDQLNAMGEIIHL